MAGLAARRLQPRLAVTNGLGRGSLVHSAPLSEAATVQTMLEVEASKLHRGLRPPQIFQYFGQCWENLATHLVVSWLQGCTIATTIARAPCPHM